MHPMLASPGGSHRPGWWAQQKFDGMAPGGRRVIAVTDGTVTGWSRKGTKAHVPQPIVDELAFWVGIGWDITLDGELMDDGTWWVFDLIAAGPTGCPLGENMTLAHRVGTLEDLFLVWNPDPAAVRLAYTARTTEEVVALIEQVKAEGGEGVIHKDPKGRYEPGQRGGRPFRSSRWTKEKNVRDVDCVVYAFGVGGSNNFGAAMVDPARAEPLDLTRLPDDWVGQEAFVATLVQAGVLRPVGEVTRFVGEGPDTRIGDVVTVTILYVTEPSAEHPLGRLYQPGYGTVIRHDKSPWDCTTDQLDEHRVNRSVILPLGA